MLYCHEQPHDPWFESLVGGGSLISEVKCGLGDVEPGCGSKSKSNLVEMLMLDGESWPGLENRRKSSNFGGTWTELLEREIDVLAC